MFFCFGKIKENIENKKNKRKHKKEIEEDYSFIHKHYIKAISEDNDNTSLFSHQEFSKSYIIKFSNNMTPKEIIFSPEKIQNNNITTYSDTSKNSFNKKQINKNIYNEHLDDDFETSFQKHLWGDVNASARIGFDPIE